MSKIVSSMTGIFRFFSNQRILASGLLVFLMLFGIESYLGSKYSGFRNQGDGKYYHWDRKTFWRLRPFIDTQVNGRAVHSNSAGFRGTEEYSLSSKRDLRILVLGDSRSYGIAVDDTSTFSSGLQKTLREWNLDAEVLNAGTPGYSVVQCRAKLEQLLDYQPDIAILAAGYNDRRYLLLTSPDSPTVIARTVTLRRMMEVLQWSQVVYAGTYELGQRKLQHLRKHPSPLDQVSVRVPKETFQQELERFLAICRDHSIQPILMTIEQNPSVFSSTEQAAQYIREERAQQALALLESAIPTLHVAASSYAHYLMGMCYETLQDESMAQRHFTDHRPTGSLHGEAILRDQASYFQLIDDIADRENIPVVNSRQALAQINQRKGNSDLQDYLDEFEKGKFPLVDDSPYFPRVNGVVTDLENFFRGRFVDECHYDKAGHLLLGMALADVVSEILSTNSSAQQPPENR